MKVKLVGDRIVSPQQISYLLTFLETMKTIHKLSSVLALAVLMLFPFASWAQPFGGGTGTIVDPYKIETKAHFMDLWQAVEGGNDFNGKIFTQTKDIDLEGVTLKAAKLEGEYTGLGIKLSNFKIEIPEDAEDVYLFKTHYGGIFDNVTITQPSGKKLNKLKSFSIVNSPSYVGFSNINANLDLGEHTENLDFCYAADGETTVIEKSRLSVKLTIGAATAGKTFSIQPVKTSSIWALINCDLQVEVEAKAELTNDVNLNTCLVSEVNNVVLAGKRDIKVKGASADKVKQANDAAIAKISGDYALYSKTQYPAVNKLCPVAASHTKCLGMTDNELKMDVATAKETKVNGISIYVANASYEGLRFEKGQFPAPRWYREYASYKKLYEANSKDKPFEVANVADWIVAVKNTYQLQYVKQTADLDFAAYGEVFTHPGKASGKEFHYDGGGYKISGFEYNATTDSNIALFGSSTSIRNVVLEGAKMKLNTKNSPDFACLVWVSDILSNCTLNNCELIVNAEAPTASNTRVALVANLLDDGGKCIDVTVNNSKLTLTGDNFGGSIAGGIADIFENTTIRGLIINNVEISYNGTTTIEGNIGGLVANVVQSGCSIAKSGVSGSIKMTKQAKQYKVGGFVARVADDVTIEECYSKVDLDVDQVESLGGFVGSATSNSYTIKDCYVDAQKLASAGGTLACFMGYTPVDKTRKGLVNCYARIADFNFSASESTNVRPFAAYPASVTQASDLGDFVENCYYDVKAGYPPQEDYKAFKAQWNNTMNKESSFNNWDFEDTWIIEEAAPAPRLQWEQLIPWKPAGDGSRENPYLIATLNNLRWVSQNEDVWNQGLYFKQTADIDATPTKTWNKKGDIYQGFRPIGKNGKAFCGSYDGGNRVIRNLYIAYDRDYVGFLGKVQENSANDVASLKNIRLENVKVKAGNGAKFIGAFCGATVADQAQFQDCHVTIDSVVALGPSVADIGGFIGVVNFTVTFQRLSAVAVSDKSVVLVKKGSVGGFAGFMGSYNGTMQKLSTDLNVVEAEGGSIGNMGGFIGVLDGGNSTAIENAYSLGNVNFRNAASVGSFIAKMDGSGTIRTCYAVGKVQNISSEPAVLKPDAGFGGVFVSGSLANNYFLNKQGETNITSPGFEVTGKCKGLDKAKMQSGNKDDMEGFSTIDWKFEAGKYPELIGLEAPKKGVVTLTINGTDKGTISVTQGSTPVVSGTEYMVGTELTITATPSDAEKYEAKVTVNGSSLALSSGTATYKVVEGNNAIVVTISEKSTEPDAPNPGAVEDAVFASVVVAPNPFGAELRIMNSEAVEGRYELLTIQGLVVRAGVLETDTMIETSDLTSGIYFVRFMATNGATKVVKVVKQ